MSGQIKAIFFDIDGTLRDVETGRILDSAKEGLALAKEAGVKLFVATGRHKLEMEEEKLLEDLEFDGYVTLNGQYCYTNDALIHRHSIDPADVAEMVQMAQDFPFPCIFMEAEAMYINMVNDTVIQAQQQISTAVPSVKSISDVPGKDIYQMIPYADFDMESKILSRLKNCRATRWGMNQAFDLTPKDGDKCIGIRKMLEYYHIGVEETAAVGDGDNDIGMLSYVGYGIAMGNSSEEVKQAAGKVTDRIEKDGLFKAIRYLLNQ